MVPVLLCILLLVLSSGAVLKVILEREDEPTGDAPPSPPRAAPRQVPQQVPPAQVATGPRPRTLVPPLPRHRIRSSGLLVVMVVVIGVVVAVVIGLTLALVALALRSTLTS